MQQIKDKNPPIQVMGKNGPNNGSIPSYNNFCVLIFISLLCICILAHIVKMKWFTEVICYSSSQAAEVWASCLLHLTNNTPFSFWLVNPRLWKAWRRPPSRTGRSVSLEHLVRDPDLAIWFWETVKEQVRGEEVGKRIKSPAVSG